MCPHQLWLGSWNLNNLIFYIFDLNRLLGVILKVRHEHRYLNQRLHSNYIKLVFRDDLQLNRPVFRMLKIQNDRPARKCAWP